MFIVRKKREHALLLYSLKASKKKVAKLHVFRAPKNSHVGDVALLAFRQYFDSSPTNFIECQQHHAKKEEIPKEDYSLGVGQITRHGAIQHLQQYSEWQV